MQNNSSSNKNLSANPLSGGPSSSPSFSDLKLISPILKAVDDSGYSVPTPIQIAAIPPLLNGNDLLGCAQTGTGKTAAFALPMIQKMQDHPKKLETYKVRSLVLTPTRELALQIYESFCTYGKNLKQHYTVIFGGVSQTPQVAALKKGADVLVATPGRLLDLIEQKFLNLNDLEIFVLDEADRMLDMGFIHDIRRILKLLPVKRQSLFFSATMPADIQKLAASMLVHPTKVEVTPVSSTVELIEQSVMYVEPSNKRELLKHLLKDSTLRRVIVFTRTKHGANRVVEVLAKSGISSAAIHGNKSQGARQKALESFRTGASRVLVATDIAARGIDIDNISHVINFEVPNVSESYVHRIGRTARAGAQGIAISFCDSEERAYIRDIEKLIGQTIPVCTDHPFHSQRVSEGPILSKGQAKAKIEGRQDQRPSGRRPHHRGGPPNRSSGSSDRKSHNKGHRRYN